MSVFGVIPVRIFPAFSRIPTEYGEIQSKGFISSWHLNFCLVFQRWVPAGIYLFKNNNRNTRKRCEICSKLTIKIPERRHWRLRRVWRDSYVVSVNLIWKYFSLLLDEFLPHLDNSDHVSVLSAFWELSLFLPNVTFLYSPPLKQKGAISEAVTWRCSVKRSS